MEHLIAKIRSGELNKCELTAPMFAHVLETISKLENSLAHSEFGNNFAELDDQLDQMENMLDDIACMLLGVESKEYHRVLIRLKKDYQYCLETFHKYQLLNADGKGYTADYDGTEEGEAGINFQGEQFSLPTFGQIFTRLKPEHFDAFLQMEKEKLVPRLQITPIGYKLETLIELFNLNKPKNTEFSIKTDSAVTDFEKDLCYDPEHISTDKSFKEVRVRKGKTKSELIKENSGFLIDIVVTETTFSNRLPRIRRDNLTKIYFEDIRRRGCRPLSFETYIIAQMRSLKVKQTLDPYCTAILLGSSPVTNNDLPLANLIFKDLHLTKTSGSAILERKASMRYSLRVPPPGSEL